MTPAQASSRNDALLGFIAGNEHWLVDAASGVQMVDAAITPVPLAQPCYLGLVRCRQRLLGAIDLAGLRGSAAAPVKLTERLLMLPQP